MAQKGINVPITARFAEHETDPAGQDIAHVYDPLSGTTDEDISSASVLPSRSALYLSPFTISKPFLLHVTLYGISVAVTLQLRRAFSALFTEMSLRGSTKLKGPVDNVRNVLCK